MERLYNSYFLENQLLHIVGFALVLLLGLLFRGILARVLASVAWRFLRKKGSRAPMADFFITIKAPLIWLVSLIFIYSAFSLLHFPEHWHLASENEYGLRMIVNRAFGIATIVLVTLLIVRVIDYYGLLYFRQIVDQENPLGKQLYPFTRELSKIMVVLFAFFFTLGTVFNINIANLIAGLGIGGLAVALAAKETLENLFASFTIFLDKPFAVGDFVNVGSIKGTVEEVGFRSTRIRTVERSFLTLPNKMMVDQAVDNLSKRTSQRVRFSFLLDFNSNNQTIMEVVSQIKTYLDESPFAGTDKDALVGFNEFYENAIRIVIIYYLNTLDLQEASRIKQEINLKVLEIVRANGLEFQVVAPALQ
jgi:MscS family membrane protein